MLASLTLLITLAAATTPPSFLLSDTVVPEKTMFRSRFSLQRPDASRLEWVGNVTGNEEWRTGKLTVPLVHSSPDSSPTLEVFFEMRPATTQPARSGAMLLHCGGPSSGKECAKDLATKTDMLSPEILDSFDIFGIDQRGIGDSKPNFVCEGTEGFKNSPLDFGDEKLVRAALIEQGKVAAKVREDPKFDMEGYKFYNYVGTGDLAGDLDVLRRAIGSSTMSFYGISYGTFVATTYASIFPEYTHRMVLNGVMDPTPDYFAQAELQTRAFAEISEHLIGLCQHDQDCASNLCMNASSGVCDAPAETHQVVETIVKGLRCDGTNPAGHFEAFLGNYTGWPEYPPHLQSLYQQSVTILQENDCNVLTPEDNLHVGLSANDFVFGVDYSGRGSIDWGVRMTLELHRKYPHAGLARGWYWILGSLNWPAIPAPPALSNPDVQPLVVTTLYDPQTSVQAARRVRSLFPRSAMISWQGGGHAVMVKKGLDPKDGRWGCNTVITDYILTGKVPQDGHVCRIPQNPSLGSVVQKLDL